MSNREDTHTPYPSAEQAQRGNTPWFTQLTPERWMALVEIGLSKTEMRVASFLVIPWLKARKAKKLTPYAAHEIAAESGVGLRTVWRAIGKLHKAGFLEVHAGGGRRKRNRYRPLIGAYEASRDDLKGPLKARRNYAKTGTVAAETVPKLAQLYARGSPTTDSRSLGAGSSDSLAEGRPVSVAFKACKLECVRGCIHGRCGAQAHGWLQ